MIEKVIAFTQVSSSTPSLFNFNVDLGILDELNYDKNILKRESFRYFDSKRSLTSKDEVLSLITLLDKVIQRVFNFPDSIELCFVDNKGAFGYEKPSILVYKNDKRIFEKIDTSSDIGRDNLYIQEEMHDCSGVFFFLWDLSVLPEKLTDSGRFYKEIIMMSGFLGQLISEFAEKISWKGTLFAGVMEADWKSIISNEYALKKPIFAYAFQR